MTKKDIMEYFKDINFAYNDCSRYDSLSNMLDELEQEPKTDLALERYKDLQDYFGGEEIAKSVLENQKEFKAWLERLHWNTRKVDELARKLEALEQEPKTDVIDKIKAEIHENAEMQSDGEWYLNEKWIMQIIDKYRGEG